eukprot:CAMPEP_0174719910 /NCGR_PEP_ID=MMETSP1094-20130205/32323_1 /TAXON_ID=156173 /ORGANISM="Chrysochromulina brevifilum, Strain UTEX LB 985" /LENGTH=88 /DNA_ID=CAMNT_0015920309 /DNA_START=816 /DNA_END=1083 /DNA_ORIENTATION=-
MSPRDILAITAFGSGPAAEGRSYEIFASKSSFSVWKAQSLIFFSSHVLPPVFQALPPAAVPLSANFWASSAEMLLGGGAALAEEVRAQ